jgi:hypothetical protein
MRYHNREDHKLYFVQNVMIITSFMQNVQCERPIIFLHTWSYIPEHHNIYLALVKMVTVLFMHDVTNQTITTFIIYLFVYLFIYLFVPATSGICITVVIPKLAFYVVSTPVWYTGFPGIKYPPGIGRLEPFFVLFLHGPPAHSGTAHGITLRPQHMTLF